MARKNPSMPLGFRSASNLIQGSKLAIPAAFLDPGYSPDFKNSPRITQSFLKACESHRFGIVLALCPSAVSSSALTRDSER